MRATWAVVAVGSVVLSLAGCSEDKDEPVKPHGEVGVPGAEVVVKSIPREGWKTIEYQGVRVNIPDTWERVDMSACEFQHEHWAAPSITSCDFESGVAFYGSDTFDPLDGPGIRPAGDTDTNNSGWAGYTYAGDDWAVYAEDTDRTVVETVLRSANPVKDPS